MNMITMFAATAALNWTMPDGKVVAEAQELVPLDGGVKLELRRGVYRTGYSNGESVVVNYTDKPFDFNGSTVAAKNWRLVGRKLSDNFVEAAR